MAVAGLTVTRERESVVDFTVAYMPTTVDMVLKKTMVEEIDFLQFMMPLQIPVWIMIIVCQLVVTAAIYTLNYYSPYGYKDEEGKGTSPEFNLFNSLWFSLACMLQQGGDNTPKATSGQRKEKKTALSSSLSRCVIDQKDRTIIKIAYSVSILLRKFITVKMQFIEQDTVKLTRKTSAREVYYTRNLAKQNARSIVVIL